MGGFLAYNLGNMYNIRTLLFNPSLEKNNIKKPIIKKVDNFKIEHNIILGINDNIVIPSDTLNFLKKSKVNFVSNYETSGHRTSLEIFMKHFLLNFS